MAAPGTIKDRVDDQHWTQNADLFKKYLAGDVTATTQLFIALEKILKSYFRARMGASSDVADLTQITLLKIHFARDRYDQSKSLKTWVFTIASRSLIDHWRGAREETESLDAESEDCLGLLETLPSDLLTPDEKVRLNNDLNAALESLKPIDRSIVYLYGVERCSMAEIAEVHGLSEPATKVRAHRAYHELRKLLGVLFLVLSQICLGDR